MAEGHSVKDTYISLALSIVVHLCIAMLFIGLSMGSRKTDQIVVVDLTLMAGQGGVGTDSPGPRTKAQGNGGTKGMTEAARMKPGLHDKPAAGDPQPSTNSARADYAPEVSTQASQAAADPQRDTAAHGGQPGQGRKEGPGSGYGEGGGTGLKGAGGGFGAGGTGLGPGGGGIQGGSDYYYIREMVMKNIKYPEKARRMGQEGRVVLSFIVLESGATSEIKVLSSCGFKLLDESAKEGVMRTVIQKKVPYKVVVTLPISYKLQ